MGRKPFFRLRIGLYCRLIVYLLIALFMGREKRVIRIVWQVWLGCVKRVLNRSNRVILLQHISH
jgi:hypothetical protein